MPKIKKTKKIEDIVPSSPLFTQSDKKKLPLIIGVVVFLAVVLLVRKQLLAATVNGEPIGRLAVIAELEKQGGKNTLDSLITETIILQQAKKNNVKVTDKEVDKQIADIEKSLKSTGQTLDAALIAQNLTKDGLKKQIKLQKMLEKLVGQEVKVTEKEIDAYVKQNEQSIPKGSDMKEIRKQAGDQLKQQKMNEKIKAWIDDQHKKAKIEYLKKY